MDLLNLVRLSVVLISMVEAKRLIEKMHHLEVERLRNEQFKVLTKDPRPGQAMCSRLSKEPYFSVDMLLGTAWRIYYSWNMDFQNDCLDLTFRNATSQIVNRIYVEMNEYLEVEPNWIAATVLVSVGRARHEMLLFTEPRVPGRFQGVPNIIKDGRITPPERKVPLLMFHLKVLYGGKYLLMADCQLGVTTLSARRRTLPNRAEIGSIAEILKFGPGLFACQSDIKKYEG